MLFRPGRNAPAGDANATRRVGDARIVDVPLTVKRLRRTGSVVLGRRLDVLVHNRLAGPLITEFRELLRRYAIRHGSSSLIRTRVSSVRSGTRWPLTLSPCCAWDAGRYPDDEKLSALVGELSIRSVEFWSWCSNNNVERRTTGTKAYHHPLVGISRSNTRHSTHLATPIRSSSSTPRNPDRPTKRRRGSCPLARRRTASLDHRNLMLTRSSGRARRNSFFCGAGRRASHHRQRKLLCWL